MTRRRIWRLHSRCSAKQNREMCFWQFPLPAIRPTSLYAIGIARALHAENNRFDGAVPAGEMASLCDVCIKVPGVETFKIQEYHLPVYHALCMCVEEEFFGE